MWTSFLRVATVVAVGLLWTGGTPGATVPERGASLDRDTVMAAANALVDAVRAAVRAGGGDPDHQAIRLVLCFSTGHFADDPVRALAAREIAAEFLSRLPAAPGDSVRVYAYEMGLWQPSEAAGAEHRISSASPDEIRRLARLFPLTPRAGSQGGHDTERAVAEISEALADVTGEPPTGYVLLLVSNDAASVNPNAPGEHTWGEDDPRYRQALSALRAQRPVPVNKAGASLVLRFRATLADGRAVERELQVVILRPEHFTGAALAHQRPPPGQRGTNDGGSGHGRFPWAALVSIPILIAAAVVGVRWLPVLIDRILGGAHTVVVAGGRYELQGLNNGQEICHLAGPGYDQAEKDKTLVPAGSKDLPPIVLARVHKRGRLAAIRGDGETSIEELDGERASGEISIGRDGKHAVTLVGRYRKAAHLQPTEFRFAVEIFYED